MWTHTSGVTDRKEDVTEFLLVWGTDRDWRKCFCPKKGPKKISQIYKSIDIGQDIHALSLSLPFFPSFSLFLSLSFSLSIYQYISLFHWLSFSIQSHTNRRIKHTDTHSIIALHCNCTYVFNHYQFNNKKYVFFMYFTDYKYVIYLYIHIYIYPSTMSIYLHIGTHMYMYIYIPYPCTYQSIYPSNSLPMYLSISLLASPSL